MTVVPEPQTQHEPDEPAFASRLPAPPLRPFIDRYLGYRLDGLPGAVHRGLPSRHLTMIVSVGEPIHVLAQTDPRQAPAAYGFVLSGLQLSPALIAADHHQEGIAIELTPLGARSLLGMPAVELWDQSVEASEVLGRAADELRERVHGHTRWPDRFDACDDILARRVLDNSREAPEQLRGAWRMLVSSGGTAPVAEMAAHVGWSRRNLHQRFVAEFGLTPKEAARVVRFQRACDLLRSTYGAGRRPSFADIAVACGYYDQPHLNRDFSRLAGSTPLAWLQSEFPFVQDSRAPVPSGSGA